MGGGGIQNSEVRQTQMNADEERVEGSEYRKE